MLCIFLLATSIFVGGCCCTKQVPEELSLEKEPAEMIQIRNLTLTDKTLTLDYQASNIFEYEIWTCEDIDTRSKYDVEIRIDGETVWIKLRSNLEGNILPMISTLSKYHRLAPGESHSGRIVMNLPIRNASPVYDFGDFGKEHKQVVLYRVVFEIGYFEGKLFDVLSERIEKGKRDTTGSVGLQLEAFVLEEIKHLQSPDTVYLSGEWSRLTMEKFANVIITDVDIPCSVVIGDK